MAKVGISRCSVPEWALKKTKTAADKINAKIDELAALGRDAPKQRDTLLADALAGKVRGEDFIRRRDDLRQGDLQLMVDVETVPLYLGKCALRAEIVEAGRKEAERLNALADEREQELVSKLEGFQTRQAEKTAMLRTDTELRRLRGAATTARNVGNDFVRPEDQAWWNGFQMRLRVALGLPATDATGRTVQNGLGRSIFK
jgi:hypothetical protein